MYSSVCVLIAMEKISDFYFHFQLPSEDEPLLMKLREESR